MSPYLCLLNEKGIPKDQKPLGWTELSLILDIDGYVIVGALVHPVLPVLGMPIEVDMRLHAARIDQIQRCLIRARRKAPPFLPPLTAVSGQTKNAIIFNRDANFFMGRCCACHHPYFYTIGASLSEMSPRREA